MKKSSLSKKLTSAPYLVWAAIFIVVPLIFVAYYSLTDANGNKNYGAFNPNREYFSYNGYGNLVSSDYKDYSGHLDHYCVERMSKYRSHISSIDDDEELSALFDALEEDEDDE